MQRIIQLPAACGMGIIMIFANSAWAAQTNITIHDLPDAGTVTISGTVEKVDNNRKFTLRDNSGTVDVKLATSESVVLKQGDDVTVTGNVERPFFGLWGKDISASSIQVHKDLPSALSDAVTQTTGITFNKAESAQIGTLPAEGMVQITGTVDSISDQKDFTLKDPTGTIGVIVQSDENVALAKGAEVTVTGYVKNSLLGKKISATHVLLMSNAPANTGNIHANVN